MAAQFVIKGAAKTQEVGANGNLVDMMQVSYETVPSSSTGFVRVPMTPDWRERALALIAAEAADIESLFAA